MTYSDQLTSALPPLVGFAPAEVAARVIAILAEQAGFEPSEVSRDSSLDSLGLDSLGLVESFFAIEEAFDISVPFDAHDSGVEGAELSSVASLIAAVERLVLGKAG